MTATLTPERVNALLRWLDAAAPHVHGALIAEARDAVQRQDPRAYGLCADVRGAFAFAGADIAVREAMGYFDDDCDLWHEHREALLDLYDVALEAGYSGDGRTHISESEAARWHRHWDAYSHALNVAGLDREALLRLRTRGMYVRAGLRLALRRHPTGPCRTRPATRCARTPVRRPVLTTPAPCNAPPTGGTAVSVLSTAAPP